MINKVANYDKLNHEYCELISKHSDLVAKHNKIKYIINENI